MIRLALIAGVIGLVQVSSVPAQAQQSTPWYNCRTRELWSPEKKAWCQLIMRRKPPHPLPCQQNEALRNKLRSARNSTANLRDSYNTIDLQQLESSLTGSNPSAIALSAFGINEPQEGNFQQSVSVDNSNPQQPIVTITQTNLPDDSVRDVRYRVEFESAQSQWRMVWAGRQHRCQQGRGSSQDWTTATCS